MHPAGSQQDRAGCGPDQTTQGMTAQLKASPVVLGGGFFVGFFFFIPPIFFSRGGLYQTVRPRAVGKGLCANAPPAAQRLHPPLLTRKFCFS